MSVLIAVAATTAAMAVFGGIAGDRMRAYGLRSGILDTRAIVIGVGVILARGWLAWRGAGGVDTSLVLAIGAVAAITDVQCGYVFDRVSFAGVAALITAEAACGSAGSALLGGMAAASALAIPWALSRTRGMGLGDVKLAGALGCGLGPYDAMRALWFAFVLGAMAAIACIVTRRRSLGGTLPFAPFLALGTFISAGSTAW